MGGDGEEDGEERGEEAEEVDGSDSNDGREGEREDVDSASTSPSSSEGWSSRPTTLLPKVVMPLTPRRSTSEVTAAELRVLAQSPTYEVGRPWLAHLASSYAASWDVLRSLCRHSGTFCMFLYITAWFMGK